MCNDERSCTHWTWLGNHVGDTFKRRCILKTSDNGVRSYAGVVSGDGNCTSLPLGWYNYIYILMLYLRPIKGTHKPKNDLFSLSQLLQGIVILILSTPMVVHAKILPTMIIVQLQAVTVQDGIFNGVPLRTMPSTEKQHVYAHNVGVKSVTS